MNQERDNILITSFILAYLPSSLIDPIVMPVIWFFLLYKGVSRAGFRMLMVYFILSMLSIFYVSFHYEVNPTSFLNKLWSFSVFMIPFCIKGENGSFSPSTIRFLTYLLLFESLIGVIQYMLNRLMGYSFSGDVVEGTLDIAIRGVGGLTHQSYILVQISLLFLLLFVFGRNYSKIRVLAVSFALGSIIFASVVHMLLAVFLALGVIIVTIYLKNLIALKLNKFLIVLTVLLVVVSVISINTLGERLRITHYYNVAFEQSSKFAKAQLIKDYYEQSTINPGILLFGFGPGQFNSRSAQMFSGEYLKSGSQNKFLKQISFNLRSDSYLRSVSEFVQFQRSDNYAWGSTGSPSSSFLGLLFEHGLILVVFLSILYFRYVRKLDSSYITMASLFILFLLFTAIQENYIELSSQVLPVFIILGRLSKS